MRFRPTDDATRLVQYELPARATQLALRLDLKVTHRSLRAGVSAMVVERKAIVVGQFLVVAQTT